MDSSNTVIDYLIYLDADGTERNYWSDIFGATKTRWIDNSITVGTINLIIAE